MPSQSIQKYRVLLLHVKACVVWGFVVVWGFFCRNFEKSLGNPNLKEKDKMSEYEGRVISWLCSAAFTFFNFLLSIPVSALALVS